MFSKEEIKAVLEIIDQAEDFRPIVEKCFKTLKSYGPELDSLFGGISEWSVKQRIKSIKMLQQAGFTRAEAIYITMDQWWQMRHSLDKAKKSQK